MASVATRSENAKAVPAGPAQHSDHDMDRQKQKGVEAVEKKSGQSRNCDRTAQGLEEVAAR